MSTELVWNLPKKSAAKSNAERAWQTIVNKDRQCGGLNENRAPADRQPRVQQQTNNKLTGARHFSRKTFLHCFSRAPRTIIIRESTVDRGLALPLSRERSDACQCIKSRSRRPAFHPFLDTARSRSLFASLYANQAVFRKQSTARFARRRSEAECQYLPTVDLDPGIVRIAQAHEATERATRLVGYTSTETHLAPVETAGDPSTGSSDTTRGSRSGWSLRKWVGSRVRGEGRATTADAL